MPKRLNIKHTDTITDSKIAKYLFKYNPGQSQRPSGPRRVSAALAYWDCEFGTPWGHG